MDRYNNGISYTVECIMGCAMGCVKGCVMGCTITIGYSMRFTMGHNNKIDIIKCDKFKA